MKKKQLFENEEEFKKKLDFLTLDEASRIHGGKSGAMQNDDDSDNDGSVEVSIKINF